ncbi:MAG: AAA family ATPase [Prevotella sp.]|nr:AAA family ATPase [Prevotella sp.]
MKYLDIKTVVDSYQGFQDCMTNKSWGYLALLRGCIDGIRSLVPYEVDMDIVSNFLEDIFNLSQTKRKYNGGRSLYVVFSNKWEQYFKDQGRYSPNIYDVAVWAYRRKGFSDNVTKEIVINDFSKEFNIPMSVIKDSFNTQSKDITFADSLYPESFLKSELERIGVDVSKNNIDAKKGGVVASPGEISRGPFVQTLYAGLDITDYVLILQSNYDTLYGASLKKKLHESVTSASFSTYRPYITAIKSKPFLLLAGISGTGKSRIVRELARACWDVDSDEYKAQKPRNFEMVQVKPNWHDSSELIGYVSRIDGVRYVVGPFLKFMVKAIQDPNTPYFLCLDEMNLAPVEQYFAEYLSVVESRKRQDDGTITTDPIVDYSNTEEYKSLIDQLFPDDYDFRKEYLTEEGGKRLSIPNNLIVIGTVNMDETTFSFSRKVLDRAMTIEMNEVDLEGGLDSRYEKIGKLGAAELIGTAVEGVDVYSAYKSVCDTAIAYLQQINNVLEGTPFKIAYRTRNEVLLYVVNNLPYNKIEGDEDSTYKEEFVIARALDEITNMKILSRIEGDESKVSKDFLDRLGKAIKDGLETVFAEIFDEEDDDIYTSVSLAKLDEMKRRLNSGYTSFWS